MPQSNNLLSLMSHNAYWFQGAPSLWGEERPRPHPDLLPVLAKLYDSIDIDILGLQEVPSSKVLAMLCGQLSMEGAFFPGGRRSTYGGALLWQGRGANVEDLTQAAATTFERICLKLDISVKNHHLVVVNLHLASNRYAPQRRGESIRLAELESLFALCPTPDIVMGDFNATPDSAVYARMIERGFIDCGQDYNEHGRPPQRRIDYIWIRPEAGLSVVEYEVIQDHRFVFDNNSGVYLSDHHPVRVCLGLDPPN